MEVGEIRRVQHLNVHIMLAVEWRHVSIARCGTLRNLPPRSRASPQGRDADRRACGRVYFGHHFDLDKVRQALNADSPPLLTSWDVEQRTRVIGEGCRVEHLDAG